MTDFETVTLDSGLEAQIVGDSFNSDAVVLVVDGTPQSHVNLDDPGSLFFEYVQRMGNAIDALALPGKPISALHLGGGAYTLPRYIEATRPGSSQQIIELDAALIKYVRESIPLPKRARIKVRQGDARERLEKLPGGMLGNMDTVIVDVFSGASTPAHLTSNTFFTELLPFMHDDSVLLVNSSHGPGENFARKQLAGLREIFKNVTAVAHTQTIKGRRFGNIVLIASNTNTNVWQGVIQLVYAKGPHPASLLNENDLNSFIGDHKPILDESALASPEPPRSIFTEASTSKNSSFE